MRAHTIGLLAVGAALGLLAACGAKEKSGESESGVEEICLDDCGSALAPIEFSVADDSRYQDRVEEFATQESIEVYFGDETDPDELTSVMGFTRTPSGEVVCSGVLIASRIALTAQHCLASISYAHFGVKTPSGAPIALSDDAHDRLSARIAVDGVPAAIDVALVKLDGPAPAGVAPASIAATPLIDAASALRVAGYGATESGSVGRKLKADVVIVSSACDGADNEGAKDADLFGCNPRLEIVAGGAGGAVARSVVAAPDTCKGDSGGGAFAANAPASTDEAHGTAMDEGQYALAGITSRSIKRSAAYRAEHGDAREAVCGSGGVYVRLDGKVRDWLVRNVQQLGGEISIASAPATASMGN